MYLRMLSYVAILLAAIIFLTAGDVAAQRCIGSTRYAVRDEKGKIIAGENLKSLIVKNINGIPVRLQPTASEIGLFYYEADFVRAYYQDNVVKEFRRETYAVLESSNPLIFGVYRPTICGEVGDLTLEYRGREMRLIFDIPEHNTRYVIDSLPFQAGTFYRTGLGCSGGVAPPMIDNNSTGQCLVAADTWKKADENWVRPLRWTDSWARRDRTASCVERKIEVIGNHGDWVAAWELHRGPNNSDPLPAIDFKTEAVLIVHLPERARLGYDFGSVTMKGDLVFRPLAPANRFTSDRCTIWLLRIYRSGIKTIGGKRLPVP